MFNKRLSHFIELILVYKEYSVEADEGILQKTWQLHPACHQYVCRIGYWSLNHKRLTSIIRKPGRQTSWKRPRWRLQSENDDNSILQQSSYLVKICTVMYANWGRLPPIYHTYCHCCWDMRYWTNTPICVIDTTIISSPLQQTCRCQWIINSQGRLENDVTGDLG